MKTTQKKQETRNEKQEARNEKLATALNKIQNRYVLKASGLPLILLPDDQYFVERALIELGLLKGDRNRCAHKAYLTLMEDIGCTLRGGTPHNRDFARGARCITKDSYPWQVADTEEGHEYAEDIQRRRSIYHYLRKELAEAGLIHV